MCIHIVTSASILDTIIFTPYQFHCQTYEHYRSNTLHTLPSKFCKYLNYTIHLNNQHWNLIVLLKWSKQNVQCQVIRPPNDILGVLPLCYFSFNYQVMRRQMTKRCSTSQAVQQWKQKYMKGCVLGWTYSILSNTSSIPPLKIFTSRWKVCLWCVLVTGSKVNNMLEI